MCSDLYGYFRYCLGKKRYYPPGSEEVCRNRTFGMFHSSTSDANKQIILESLSKPDGTVRVVFATTALGMGVNRLYAKLNDVIRTANAEINYVKKFSDTKKALFTA